MLSRYAPRAIQLPTVPACAAAASSVVTSERRKRHEAAVGATTSSPLEAVGNGPTG